MSRFTLGRLLYLTRATFRHGVKAAWYRDVVRHRILETEPIFDTTDAACEIHVLTSKDDWLNLIWVLKSLFAHESCRFTTCIHEDGTVPKEGITHLRHHFPAARIIPRDTADAHLARLLGKYPRSSKFRSSNPFSLKVFDFCAFLQNDRLMLLDSDILFFKSPTVLVERLRDRNYRFNSLNRDWGYGYSVPKEEFSSHFDFTVHPEINSGLGLIHKESMRLDWIEEFLALPSILSHRHRIEQTLIAICSSRHGFEMLPREYDVTLNSTDLNAPVKHYTSPIRHLMYREGLSRLRYLTDSR